MSLNGTAARITTPTTAATMQPVTALKVAEATLAGVIHQTAAEVEQIATSTLDTAMQRLGRAVVHARERLHGTVADFRGMLGDLAADIEAIAGGIFSDITESHTQEVPVLPSEPEQPAEQLAGPAPTAPEPMPEPLAVVDSSTAATDSAPTPAITSQSIPEEMKAAPIATAGDSPVLTTPNDDSTSHSEPDTATPEPAVNGTAKPTPRAKPGRRKR
jgi:hypothetical protein